MRWSKVESIEEVQYESDTYNLHIEDNHNYFANSLMVSNCHLASSKSITNLVQNKLINCPIKLGFTGTIQDSQVNELQLKGIFGPVYQTTSTAELMESNRVSKATIKFLVFDYNEGLKLAAKGLSYQDEVNLINSIDTRTDYIAKLAISKSKNTVILFRFLEHGKSIYNRIVELNPDRKVFYISGETEAEAREMLRTFAENNDCIIVASAGVLSTGVSIKNLHILILAFITKSKVKVLQSLGRILRLHSDKDRAIVYDIVDSFEYNNEKNYALKHGESRLKYYTQEKLDIEVHKIPIN